MNEPTDLAVATAVVDMDFPLPTGQEVEKRMRDIEVFRELVRKNLHDKVDFGVIEGTEKPTLYKPGAEKIVRLLRCADTYEIIEQIDDWDRPLFAYTVRARLIFLPTGQIVSEGLGECNSREGKYRWRMAQRSCPQCDAETIYKSKRDPEFYCWFKMGGCGATFPMDDPAIIGQVLGRVENEDVASLRNTFLKMAKKRSLTDAALSAGRLSDLFTQDLEETAPPATTEGAPPQNVGAPAVNGGEPAPARSGEDPEQVAAAPQFQDLGAFLNAVKDRWGRSTGDLCRALGAPDPQAIKDPQAAWAKLVEMWGAGRS